MITRKLIINKSIVVGFIVLSVFINVVQSLGQIIYAINCGGEAHVDTLGIHYDRDPLNGKVGISSDYGKRLLIGRVHPDDNILYQTERYHTNTFGYDIPVSADGDYVLILKFCEVYFNAPDQKVFDIVLNGDHTIISDLDIYDKVGRGFAHDEYVPFQIYKGRLLINGEDSEIRGGRIRVEFIKGYKDNPKINAIVVIRGQLKDVPKLPPMELDPSIEEQLREQQMEDEIAAHAPKATKRPNVPPKPKQEDPYTMEDSSIMLPVFIAVGAFIPILFCLCKL